MGLAPVDTGNWDMEGVVPPPKPGFWESLIPFWGAARNAGYELATGNVGWGAFYTGLAAAEIIPLRAALSAAGSLRTAGEAVTRCAREITAESSMLARSSEAAFRAAGRADEFALGAKHAAGAGGRWAKFAEGVNSNAALRETLTSPGARILPNDTNSFKIVADLGRVVGSRGETGIRAVVDFEGHVVTWFPVLP